MLATQILAFIALIKDKYPDTERASRHSFTASAVFLAAALLLSNAAFRKAGPAGDKP